jgi:hypothetical protein
MAPDPLRAERAAALHAIAAASNAMTRLTPLITDQPLSPHGARNVLQAVQLLAEKQTAALSASTGSSRMPTPWTWASTKGSQPTC